jgi:hypothetical protein
LNALAKIRQKLWVALAGENGTDALSAMIIVLADLHGVGKSALGAEAFAEKMHVAIAKAINNHAEIIGELRDGRD